MKHKNRFTVTTLLIALLSVGLACHSSKVLNAQTQPETTSKVAFETERYAWLAEWPGQLPRLATLLDQFPTPDKFSRVSLNENSFGRWLRGLPLRLDRNHVLSYRGDVLDSPAAAVLALDLGPRDLQQCADSAIRLHAEFAWAKGKREAIGYHFTSGYRSSWSRWRRGERFRPRGRDVEPYLGKARKNNHAEFRDYLQHLFRYAGTRSLQFDSDAVASSEHLQPGDFLVQPGGPGHAVVILDIAIHRDDPSRRVALIGQGFMPAQDFHVLQSPHRHLNRAWFPLPPINHDQGSIDTPSWRPFKRADARRFKPISRPDGAR